jgi:hypothetical protein
VSLCKTLTIKSSSRLLTRASGGLDCVVLDDVVQALEELDLREAGQIPTRLKEKLLHVGIPIHGSSITELIDVVLGSQEKFLLQERRTGRRRRRLTYVPTDEELASVVSRRYQR